MRKITLLAILFASFSFAANAANVLVENFGSVPVEQIQIGANKYWPYVSQFTGWDNQAPITFSNTVENVTIRKTSALDNHAWFPAAKESDLIIDNIPAANFGNLKITFDITCNADGGDASKLSLFCNDVAVNVPSMNVGKNAFVTVPEIALANAPTLKLRFYFSPANNPTNMGYRIDNIKITGEAGQSIATTTGDDLNIFVANGTVNFTTEKSVKVTVFNTVGQVIVNKMSEVGANQITLPKGQLLIVKVGQKAVKVKM